MRDTGLTSISPNSAKSTCGQGGSPVPMAEAGAVEETDSTLMTDTPCQPVKQHGYPHSDNFRQHRAYGIDLAHLRDDLERPRCRCFHFLHRLVALQRIERLALGHRRAVGEQPFGKR